MRMSLGMGLLIGLFPAWSIAAESGVSPPEKPQEKSIVSYKHKELVQCRALLESVEAKLKRLKTRNATNDDALNQITRLHASAKLRLRFAKYQSCIGKAQHANALLQLLSQNNLHLSTSSHKQDK